MQYIFNNKNFYRFASGIKIILGILTMLLTYTNININEDPTIAIGLGFTGLFILLWGISFFIFWGVLYMASSEDTNSIRIQKDSYKSSLLFGIYIMLNVLLVISEQWNKVLGLVLLAIFILLHIILFRKQPINAE